LQHSVAVDLRLLARGFVPKDRHSMFLNLNAIRRAGVKLAQEPKHVVLRGAVFIELDLGDPLSCRDLASTLLPAGRGNDIPTSRTCVQITVGKRCQVFLLLAAGRVPPVS
jgi:hypothetical protein